MDSSDEIIYHSEGYIKIYKSGRAERLYGMDFVPPSIDHPTGVSSKDTTIVPGVTARLYVPKIDSEKKLPVLVHFHGGAFCMGSPFEPLEHSYITLLVARANVIVVSVHHRLAPEHYLPAAYEDSYAALDWVLSHMSGGTEPWLTDHGDFTRVYASGESSGANIAHHMAMYGGAKLHGAVLIHPYFLSSEKVESDEFNPEMAEKLKEIWKVVCPSTMGFDDPWINPLAEDAPPIAAIGCKRVLVLVGGSDTLRDRGKAYYEQLKASEWEGEVKYWEAADEGHGFYLMKPEAEMSILHNKIIADFLNKAHEPRIRDEIIFQGEGIIKIYKSGRAERFHGLEYVPPSTDQITGVSSKDTMIVPDVTARLYIPKIESGKKLPIVIHFHAGAFCMGSPFEPLEHNYITSLVARANVIVVSVNHRLAPEHYLPAAYEDSYAALDWVLSHTTNGPEPWLTDHGDFTRVYASGESSGATIAHHMAMYGGSKLHGLILIQPYFLSSEKVKSDALNTELAEKLEEIWKVVCPSTTGLDDPLINPFAKDALPIATLGCKRVLVLVAGVDTLRDRGKAYYKQLKASEWEGEAKYWEAADEQHSFYLMKPEAEASVLHNQIIADFLNEL